MNHELDQKVYRSMDIGFGLILMIAGFCSMAIGGYLLYLIYRFGEIFGGLTWLDWYYVAIIVVIFGGFALFCIVGAFQEFFDC